MGGILQCEIPAAGNSEGVALSLFHFPPVQSSLRFILQPCCLGLSATYPLSKKSTKFLSPDTGPALLEQRPKPYSPRTSFLGNISLLMTSHVPYGYKGFS